MQADTTFAALRKAELEYTADGSTVRDLHCNTVQRVSEQVFTGTRSLAPRRKSVVALASDRTMALERGCSQGYATGDPGTMAAHDLPGSPAAEGGIQLGDVMLTVEGYTVRTTADVERLVEEHAFDGRVLIDIERAGRKELLRVPLTVEPEAPARALPSALPKGRYSCLHIYYDYMDERTRFDPAGTLSILPGQGYRWFEGQAGRFIYDAGSGNVHWQGGVFGQQDSQSRLEWADERLMLKIVTQVDPQNSITYRCYRQEEE